MLKTQCRCGLCGSEQRNLISSFVHVLAARYSLCALRVFRVFRKTSRPTPILLCDTHPFYCKMCPISLCLHRLVIVMSFICRNCAALGQLYCCQCLIIKKKNTRKDGILATLKLWSTTSHLSPSPSLSYFVGGVLSIQPTVFLMN